MDILNIVKIVWLVLIGICFLIIVLGLIPLLKAIKERNDTWKRLSPKEKAKYKELKKHKGA